MSRARQPVPSQTLDTPLPQPAQASCPSALNAMMLAQRAGGGGNAFAQSLIGPSLTGALGACFGPAARQISIQGGQDASNQAIGALASTRGRRVSLSSAVDPEGGDRQSLEILGHEVAHALAGGGAGQTEVDQPGDPGEARADQAGARFADWVEGGMTGPTPRLTPATGGRARVHRWEGAEHKDAVDGAVHRLEAAGRDLEPSVAATMQQRVVLGNGMELSPGQVTALMGDFYGVVDEEGNVDPSASFDQLWNADPVELQALLDQVAVESPDHEIPSSTWECATQGRDGALSYMELAERNDSHFSSSEMTGTDNNMGNYAALHAMALQKAAVGTPEAANEARGLEAAAAHYLTDRHSGGHNFDKEELMEATEHDPRGKLANGHAKWTHDQMNTNGVDVSRVGTNQMSADTWRAYGDGRWWDDANAENRVRTAESVYTSYQELEWALGGQADPAQIADRGYAALNTVPEWSEARQAQVEGSVQFMDAQVGGDSAIATAYAGKLADLLLSSCPAEETSTPPSMVRPRLP